MEDLARQKKEIGKLHVELAERTRVYKKSFEKEYNQRLEQKNACSKIEVKDCNATVTRHVSGSFICKFADGNTRYEFQVNIMTRFRDGYELRIYGGDDDSDDDDNVSLAWFLHVKDGVIQDPGVEKKPAFVERVKDLYPKLEELRARFPPYSRYTILAEMEEDILKELNKI